jgi:hypothetical protein
MVKVIHLIIADRAQTDPPWNILQRGNVGAIRQRLEILDDRWSIPTK